MLLVYMTMNLLQGKSNILRRNQYCCHEAIFANDMDNIRICNILEKLSLKCPDTSFAYFGEIQIFV